MGIDKEVLGEVVGKLKLKKETKEAEKKFFGGSALDENPAELKKWSKMTDEKTAKTINSSDATTASSKLDDEQKKDQLAA